jgi:putative transcriptional regulator
VSEGGVPLPSGPITGRLLVATPLLGDPNFERTVVLVLAHGDEGALGVVLNRPTATRADELVPGWGERAAEPAVMFLGGPVGQNGVIGLHPGGTIDLNVPPEESDDVPERLRLFAGSAGWSGGQLEDELGEGAWWVLDAEPDDAFSASPSTLWSRVLRRQRGTTAWFAVYPPDPLVN